MSNSQRYHGPGRPPGPSGPPAATPTRALVNAFELRWSEQSMVYHYDVITPLWPTKKPIKIGFEKGSEIVMRVQTTVGAKVFKKPGAFDGKRNLFSFMNYDIPAQQFRVPWDNAEGMIKQGREVTVMFSLVNQVNVSLLRNLLGGKSRGDPEVLEAGGGVSTAINMLNLSVQAHPRRTGTGNLYKGKSFYVQSGNRPTMAPLQLWRGYFQSVRPTMDRIILNVDVTMGVVVPTMSLENLCCQHLRMRNTRDLKHLRMDQFFQLKSFIRSIKVSVTMPGRRGRRPKAIKDLLKDVEEYEFDKAGVVTTVGQHFHAAHNMRIEPRSLGIRLFGNEVVPISVCEVPQQLYKPRLSPEGVRHMLDFSPSNPQTRLEEIRRGWAQLGHSGSEFLAGAGITVNSQPLQVDGKVLPSPLIVYRGHNAEKPEKISLNKPGMWDVMRRKLFIPVRIASILVVNITGHPFTPSMSAFVDDLVNVMRERGLQVDAYNRGIVDINPQADIEKVLVENGRKMKPNLILAILPENAAPIYNCVKRFGDIIQGVATQCVRWNSKLAKYDARQCNQYHNNLILKINVKLGGVNHNVESEIMKDLSMEPTMVIGADVSHAGPNSTQPSIASVVGSWDTNACRYSAKIDVQRSRLEIIERLEEMVKSLLVTFAEKNTPEDFKDKNGTPCQLYPSRIIFYRDGVSEGEFEQVRKYELKGSLWRAVKSLYDPNGQPYPKVLFIVVGKRHHMRFFPTQAADGDRTGNLSSGFVVDRGIEHPVYNDYYLQSQAGLKGTSVPGHYTILLDNMFAEGPERLEKIQRLSYALCHCYARATRSVKIPAPIYYADLVCRRAKFHFDNDPEFSDDMSEHSDESVYIKHCRENFSQVEKRMKDLMYFV